MAQVINTYTETRTHKGEKLEITINVYDNPCHKTPDNTFYTHIIISNHGKGWGTLFLRDPVEEEDFKQAIEDVYNHIEIYKTKVSNEPNSKQFSQN